MELAIRKIPAIDIDDDCTANRHGIIIAVLVGIVSLAGTLSGVAFFFWGILHWKDITIARLTGWLFGLLWTLLFAAQTKMCITGIATGISNITKRNRWLRQAIRSQVKIVDRKEEHNDYAESREEMWECSLAILWPPSPEVELPGKIAWLRVSNRIYDRYSHEDIAQILSDPSDPNVFIFEGE